MIETFVFIYCGIAVFGGLYAGYARDPYVKLIAIGLIGGATMPLLVIRGYLDVAAALAVIIPLSTVFLLQLCKKGEI